MSLFMLASGLTFKLVFEKRKKEKGIKANLLSVKREICVMGIGMVHVFEKIINKISLNGIGTV